MIYYIAAEVSVTVADATPNLNNTAIIMFNQTVDSISEHEDDRLKNEVIALIESKKITVSGVLVTKDNIKSIDAKNVTISVHNFIEGKQPIEIVYANR